MCVHVPILSWESRLKCAFKFESLLRIPHSRYNKKRIVFLFSVYLYPQLLWSYEIYHNKKKTIISFLRIERSLLVNPRVPLIQGCFVPSLVDWPSGSGEKMETWKFYRQTDDGRSEKLTWAFSSDELKNNESNFMHK